MYICNNRERHLVGGLALAAEFRFLSCQECTEIYINCKTFKRSREYVFRNEANIDYSFRGIYKPFNFNTVKRSCSRCNEEIRVLH